jgi:Putative transposase/Transposase zinc-binding domain
MLRVIPHIRYHIAAIFAAHWIQFISQYQDWIRPVVFESIRKIAACRTPVLGCHIYQCNNCGHMKLIPHSCKSRFCPTCGKHATDIWSNRLLNNLLDVPYHHLVLTIPWQLRIVIIMNRQLGLNLLARSASMAVQQWSMDIKGMRMGILVVIHTFGSDLKWHPHIHLIVTGGGLSLDGKRWIETDPRFLMYHKGLKERWKYQIITRMKELHRHGQLRFPKAKGFLRSYPCFAAMLNKLWRIVWYVYIGASLLDPRFSVQYIGRYTKRAVIAEYRITYYDGKIVRFSYKDYAENRKTSYMTVKVYTFIGRLIRHIPDKYFPMIRYSGLFCNRWKEHYLSLACKALNKPQPLESQETNTLSWRERQFDYTGIDPLICPHCEQPLVFVSYFFGDWNELQFIFEKAGCDPSIPEVLIRSG